MAATNMETTTFDVWHQNFTLRASDGTSFQASTDDIYGLQTLAANTAIVFASQLGASLMLLVVLLLMTSSGKRRSLSFAFNAMALICNVIRCTLQCVLLTSPLMNFMVLELYDWDAPGIDSAIATSIAGTVFTFLLFVFIELALITQVRVVCLAASSAQRTAVTFATGLIALVALAFRINLTVTNIDGTIHVASSTQAMEDKQTWAQSAANITAIVSIFVFSFVFCFKLAMAIKSRRSMGLKQFGAMQIIFIMGCQTLVIPGTFSSPRASDARSKLTSRLVIFAVLAYFALPGAQIRSFVKTLVAIFLPLSSMWASANTNSKHAASPELPIACHGAGPAGSSDMNSYNSNKKLLNSLTTDTLIDGDDSLDGSPLNEKKYEPRYEKGATAVSGNRESCLSDFDHDLEMQKPVRSIQVDRSYTVSSDRDVGHAR